MKFTLRELFLAFVPLALFCLAGYQIVEGHRQHARLWGPRPGWVQFQTDRGSGSMQVRDLDRAAEEVQATLDQHQRLLDLPPSRVDPATLIKHPHGG